MTFDEIARILERSIPDDWYMVPSVSGWDSFVWTMTIVTRYPDKDQEVELEGHHSRAVYRPDVGLGLAWGLTSQDEFSEPWTEVFPDKQASVEYIDVLWNGMLVDRFPQVVVDGGRSSLPLPDRQLVDGTPVGYCLRKRDHRLGRLVAGIEGRTRLKTFDEYVRRSGLVLEVESY
jgi:hypothetical protein